MKTTKKLSLCLALLMLSPSNTVKAEWQKLRIGMSVITFALALVGIYKAYTFGVARTIEAKRREIDRLLIGLKAQYGSHLQLVQQSKQIQGTVKMTPDQIEGLVQRFLGAYNKNGKGDKPLRSQLEEFNKSVLSLLDEKIKLLTSYRNNLQESFFPNTNLILAIETTIGKGMALKDDFELISGILHSSNQYKSEDEPKFSKEDIKKMLQDTLKNNALPSAEGSSNNVKNSKNS